MWINGVPVQGLLTHRQKVASLYKRALRNLESFHYDRIEFRYDAVMMRARFEANRNEPDMRKANKLLKDGEAELFFKKHPFPKEFANSPRGTAWGRNVIPPDWILDYWHPLEKAQYPEYFARREKRKEEYIKWWEEQYGKPKPDTHH